MNVGLFVMMAIWVVAFPSTAIGAMIAVELWRDRRKRRHRRPGVCRCGYDLRGNPSGRCPECGRAANTWPLRAD